MSQTPVRRVLYLTGFFPPDVIAKRAAGVATTLAGQGHRVTVITRWPAHLAGRPYTREELAEADRSLPAGVTVRRVGALERRSAGTWRRILSQMSFAARAALLATRLAPRHDLVLAYTPPPFTGVAAWFASRVGRRPLVLEVQDLYPAQALALGVIRPGVVATVAARVERLLYRGAARLVVVNEGYRDHAVAAGARADAIRVIPNACDTDAFHPDVEPLDAPWERAPFTALFAGTVGLAQGSEVLVDAAAALSHRPDVGFEVWGGGARYAEVRRAVEARGLTNVRFGPPVAHADMPRVLARGDALLLTLHPAPIFGRVVPSKLSEYLAMGRPVVAAARGTVPALLESSGAGLSAAPLDGPAVARALERLADDPGARRDMGLRARAVATDLFPRDRVLADFARVVAEVD